MRRRDFISVLGGAAATWPLAARAQQRALPVIGYLSGRAPSESPDLPTAFLQGLQELGFVEGRNVSIEYRWGENQGDRLAPMAADLVRRRATLIFGGDGIASALAAKAATTTIPIIFETGVDPVEAGLVATLNRPGGNITGITNLGRELAPKRLELLHELLPAATTIAVLLNPLNPGVEIQLRDMQSAARTLGLQLPVLHASNASDFDSVFERFAQLGAGALAIASNNVFTARREQLGALAASRAVPAIYQFREFAAAGGLMSYGGNIADSYRLAGVYAGRILKGEKPADLPVQEATKVELILNLRTAKALGITVPITLLGRADEVIE